MECERCERVIPPEVIRIECPLCGKPMDPRRPQFIVTVPDCPSFRYVCRDCRDKYRSGALRLDPSCHRTIA